MHIDPIRSLRKEISFLFKSLTIALAIFAGNTSIAQDWEWGKRIGSVELTNSYEESVVDLATDKNGNIYVLSTSLQAGMNINGVPRQGWGGQDIILSSFSCNGGLRWSKIIGSSGYDAPLKLGADSLDGVYATVGFSNSPARIDNDATININRNKALYLLKYRTDGTFQWMVSPQPDTITAASRMGNIPIDMEVDGKGNTYLFCFFGPGIYGGSYIATARTNYILQYDANGVFQGGIKPYLYIQPTNTNFVSMKRDPGTGRFYICGTNDMPGGASIGGFPIMHSAYIGCIEHNGNFWWKKENSLERNGSFIAKPLIDKQGFIYLSGTFSSKTAAHFSDQHPADTFGGYVVRNGEGHRIPVTFKMNRNGQLIWAKEAEYVNCATTINGIALRTDGELVLAGTGCSLKYEDCKDSLLTLLNTKFFDPFVVRLNTQTGKTLGVDRVTGLSYDLAKTITADGRGNVYMGGEFGSTIGPDKGGGPQIKSTADKDGFVYKYGYSNCNCSAIPSPGMLMTKLSNTSYLFTYSGSMPYTDLKWDFGDGTTSTQVNPTHTYTTKDYFDICVTVKQDCSDNTYCTSICLAPEADFTYNIKDKAGNVSFKYTGSRADDVRIFFGDKTYYDTSEITHHYATTGNYDVCVVSYTRCGTDTVCKTIQVPAAIEDRSSLSMVKLYPNPVTDMLIVNGTDNGAILITNITGQTVYSGEVIYNKTEIDTRHLSPGTYIFHLNQADGSRLVRRFIKQ